MRILFEQYAKKPDVNFPELANALSLPQPDAKGSNTCPSSSGVRSTVRTRSTGTSFLQFSFGRLQNESERYHALQHDYETIDDQMPTSFIQSSEQTFKIVEIDDLSPPLTTEPANLVI